MSEAILEDVLDDVAKAIYYMYCDGLLAGAGICKEPRWEDAGHQQNAFVREARSALGLPTESEEPKDG